ncbi:hypothetical protein ACOMHN_012016 [Nucella lapillus]
MVKANWKLLKSKWLGLLVCGLAALSSSLSTADDNECKYRPDLSSNYCPSVHNSTGGKLIFVDDYPEQPMLPTVTTSFCLSCCTGGGDSPVNSTWYKWLAEWKRWCVLEQGQECVDWNRVYTEQAGQVLIVDYAGVKSSSGTYRCVAADGHTVVNRTFDVKVVNCKTGMAVRFSTPDNAQAPVGARYVQACRGDFGCKGAVARDNVAWWSLTDHTGHQRNLTLGTHGRYLVQEDISKDKTEKAAILTINGVMEEDFNTVFTCHLTKGDWPTAGYNLSLTETKSETTWKKFTPVIITVCVVFAMLVIAGGLTYHYCRPVLVFGCKSITNRLPERKGRHSHDVMLVSREEAGEEAGEDARLMDTMTSTLKKKGYSVYSCLSGARMAQCDDVAKCVSLIFVISPAILKKEDSYLNGFDNFFSIAAEENTAIVFVTTQTMSAEEWKKLSDYKKMRASTLCPVIVWPGDRRGLRLRHDNFWCRVQCSLPKLQPPIGIAGQGRDDNAYFLPPEEAPLAGDA